MKRPSVLLTVPHWEATASPYREMMAIARGARANGVHLTVCSLRSREDEVAKERFDELGVRSMIARFRPRSYDIGSIRSFVRDQRAIEQHGPFDIQHSLDFSTSPLEAMAARLARRRFVIHQRNFGEEGHAVMARLKLRAASKVIAVSQGVADYASQLGVNPELLTVIPHGIALSNVPDRGRHSKSGTILSVGGLERRKRHEDAIRAMSRVRKRLPDASLQIVGRVYDDAYVAELGHLASSLGVADAVEFLGERSDVLGLMMNADVLLHCAESEAFGWVVLEAMALGLPVVVAAAAGPREIVGTDSRCGRVVPVGDISRMSGAVEEVLANESLARSMSLAARQRVDACFSESRMVESVYTVYRELLG